MQHVTVDSINRLVAAPGALLEVTHEVLLQEILEPYVLATIILVIERVA